MLKIGFSFAKKMQMKKQGTEQNIKRFATKSSKEKSNL